ncbi:hypothetical protein [Amycolatopsis albispora]|uniref:Uncharacterized protein n=1 Tax=Amycolatopsis albispora TaxID=1804986 RepID=A0A344L499_9PSEU|nr:hypothetical protein [Amycolatopsis albispora]AXB42873.1 hypothetical protein A4R43_10260 [Amycolatopsis albispora]
MGSYEYLYLDSDQPIAREAAWFRRELGFEPIPVQDGDPDHIGLRGPASTVDGMVGLAVRHNHTALADPAPGECQAIDAYRVEIEFWYRRRDTEEQRREARLLFDRLVVARPGTAMLLTHGSDLLTAAWLPPRGRHEFPAGTTVDEPDLETWRPWVIGVYSWLRDG